MTCLCSLIVQIGEAIAKNLFSVPVTPYEWRRSDEPAAPADEVVSEDSLAKRVHTT
jgi:hypothetical protein